MTTPTDPKTTDPKTTDPKTTDSDRHFAKMTVQKVSVIKDIRILLSDSFADRTSVRKAIQAKYGISKRHADRYILYVLKSQQSLLEQELAAIRLAHKAFIMARIQECLPRAKTDTKWDSQLQGWYEKLSKLYPDQLQPHTVTPTTPQTITFNIVDYEKEVDDSGQQKDNQDTPVS